MGLLIAREGTSTQQTNPRSMRPGWTCSTGSTSTCENTEWLWRCKCIKIATKYGKFHLVNVLMVTVHSTVSIHEMINSNMQHSVEEVPLNLLNFVCTKGPLVFALSGVSDVVDL